MKIFVLVLATVMAQGVFASILGERNACNADNCARAVTGTRPGKLPVVSDRQADCSSFMLITVTPDASTTITTKTVTTTFTQPVLAKRGDAAPLTPRAVTVSPSVVPTYASACSGPSRYSSACSCWGITQMTTTVPTPVTTITKTTTVTSSVCPPGATKCGPSCFNLQKSNGNCGACGNVCPKGTTCESGICKVPPGQCTNPTVCSGNDACGTGDCFCHPDPTGVGYCHARALCTFPTCKVNNDCAVGSVCVENCCGKVCRPIQVVCNNPAFPKGRLFRKREVGQFSDP